MTSDVLHEVWLELASGSRVVVGQDLPDVPAASQVASAWKRLAQERPDELHESMPGSGVVVRGSAIVAIRAQIQVKRSKLQGPRDDRWL